MRYILLTFACSLIGSHGAYAGNSELDDLEVDAETSFYEAQNAQRQLKGAKEQLVLQKEEMEALREAAAETKERATTLRKEAEVERIKAEKERAALLKEKKSLLAANKKNAASIKKSEEQILKQEKELLALGNQVKNLQEKNRTLAMKLEEQEERRAFVTKQLRQRRDILKSQERLLSNSKKLLEPSVVKSQKHNSRVPASVKADKKGSAVNVQLRSAQAKPIKPKKKVQK